MSEQFEQPFLEVVTRTFLARPTLLAANSAALQEQTSDDWAQTLLVDYDRRGCAYANRQLAHFTPRGSYVWVLDDDDICIRPTLVAELKDIAVLNAPDLILMRMDHGPRLGVLPGGLQWGNRKLHQGHIGVSGFVVSRETWLRFREHWGERYEGDWDFISVVAADKSVRLYWHDVIASRVQQISHGASEEDTAMRYRANKDVRVLFGGQLLDLKAGREYELLAHDAPELVRAGFVTPIIAGPETAAVAPSATAVQPKGKAKRSK